MRVNKFTKLVCRFIVIGGLTVPAVSVIADTPAFVLGAVLSNQPLSFTGTRGWQFVPASGGDDIFITQLGVFDNGGDGLVNPHQIGLWQAGNVSGTLLASATVPAGTAAPLEVGYRWVPITPVRIPYAVSSYVVAAQYSAGDADDMVTPRPSGPWPYYEFARDIGVFTSAGRAGLGNDLPYPSGWTSCGEGCIPEINWEPNLKYTVVPEPSVWVLFGSGLLFGFWRHRQAHGRQTR
jgi:hypothetical protein